MEFVFVGIGGILGSMARYSLGNRLSFGRRAFFPMGTFFVNISGAFLLGLLVNLNPGKNLYLLAAEGFLGSYTTFSTFMYEGFNLISGKKCLNALVYITLSLFLGITAFVLGTLLINLVKAN